VEFFICGQKTIVVVDDRFPYDEERGNWAMTRTSQNEIWVMVLEKAWAKVFGSY